MTIQCKRKPRESTGVLRAATKTPRRRAGRAFRNGKSFADFTAAVNLVATELVRKVVATFAAMLRGVMER